MLCEKTHPKMYLIFLAILIFLVTGQQQILEFEQHPTLRLCFLIDPLIFLVEYLFLLLMSTGYFNIENDIITLKFWQELKHRGILI